MKRCDACGGKILVKDSRSNKSGIRRRRACADCGKRTTSIELIVPSQATEVAIGGRGCRHFYDALHAFLRDYEPATYAHIDQLPVGSPIREKLSQK